MRIPVEELTRRRRKIRALESVSGILNELTPEQLEEFEAAAKRRPFFREEESENETK